MLSGDVRHSLPSGEEFINNCGTADLEAAQGVAHRNPVQIAAKLVKNRSTTWPKLTSAIITRRRGSST
jgi:hypothetical protein